MLDLTLNDPSRFFRTRQMKHAVDTLAWIASDYREWLARPHRLPRPHGRRIGIVSRLFNNLSGFRFSTVPSGDCGVLLEGCACGRHWRECVPSNCLRPSGRGPDGLIVSNARIWLESGRTFKQLSLSPFFEALHCCSNARNQAYANTPGQRQTVLPVRSFRPQCLETGDGLSVPQVLLSDCSLVIVEDADLRPTDLKDHCSGGSWPDSIAIDMTRILRLRGSFCYVLVHANDPNVQCLSGERLW